ncbi:S8 family serine peptidase [Micromonospora sp. Llam7]|uniref:S8 family serine peptidase n=1 Tax=Micromonospora tarapacensis TaxID=2835305 RepID=UPI001C83C82E|nr:S8 family serine peptidase [Micromonospora tarapacensis]MBX7265708.1 S8 family serine peptidase [Micromonospora tarapacensis]
MSESTVTPRRRARFAHSSSGARLSAGRLPYEQPVSKSWAWGQPNATGVRVCLIDSGVDRLHEELAGAEITALAVELDGGGVPRIVADEESDPSGHGTACAAIIRRMAPGCAITSIRVLTGALLRGRGELLLHALEWAVEHGYKLVNLSLSTTDPGRKERLRDILDRAFTQGTTVVAAAHNGPFVSYPWRLPTTISVGAHGVPDPEHLEANPAPPVDFFAHGVEVLSTRVGGGSCRMSGNSFAAPHVTGLCARVLHRHPEFGTEQLRQTLTALADNVTKDSKP